MNHRSGRGPGRWKPNHPDWDNDPFSGAGTGTVSTEATVGERTDMVIYGPTGDVLRIIEDRPFRGYRGAPR